MAYSYKTAEELMDESGAKQISMLLEPVGRNTAPAIALAALWARTQFGDDTVILVLAADHLIDRQAEFAAAVEDAARLAQREGRLVLFGIEAKRTGDWLRLYRVGRQHPGLQIARGRSLRGKAITRQGQGVLASWSVRLEQRHVLLHRRCNYPQRSSFMPPRFSRRPGRSPTPATCRPADQVTFDAALFGEMPDISIDYAVMEKAENVAVIPCAFGWSDIGSWKAVAQTHETDAQGNRPRAT